MWLKIAKDRHQPIWRKSTQLLKSQQQNLSQTKIKNLHRQNDNLNEECKQMTTKIHNSDIWDGKSTTQETKTDDNNNSKQDKF